jgi:hypothetical protein
MASTALVVLDLHASLRARQSHLYNPVREPSDTLGYLNQLSVKTCSTSERTKSENRDFPIAVMPSRQKPVEVVGLFAFADERIPGLWPIRVTDAHPAHRDLVSRRRQMLRAWPGAAIDGPNARLQHHAQQEHAVAGPRALFHAAWGGSAQCSKKIHPACAEWIFLAITPGRRGTLIAALPRFRRSSKPAGLSRPSRRWSSSGDPDHQRGTHDGVSVKHRQSEESDCFT